MSADPSGWEFTGAQAPVPAAEPLGREAGWRQMDVDDVGCLPAALATVLGLRAPLVLAAMGGTASLAGAVRVVEMWDPWLTLGLADPDGPFPLGGNLVIGLYQDPGTPRDDAGRYVAKPVHAAVFHAEDGALYHDPHTSAWQDRPRLGYLGVVTRVPVPAAATFPLGG